jgi:mono/diheme cytochrome c family protein
MLSNSRALAAIFAVGVFTACSSGAPPAPAPGPAEPAQPAAAAPAEEEESDPTTADGIFTVAQADRGEELFLNVCSECHDSADWTEPGFRGRWEDQSVFQLWYYINDRMPYDNPWSLSRQQVTDVLTYILQLNGLPAGEVELATDDDSIDDYWIAWNPS